MRLTIRGLRLVPASIPSPGAAVRGAAGGNDLPLQRETRRQLCVGPLSCARRPGHDQSLVCVAAGDAARVIVFLIIGVRGSPENRVRE